MRRISKYTFFLVIFASYSALLYASNEAERMQSQLSEVQRQQSSQQSQSAKPMLPPVIPLPAAGISSTISPHIAAPVLNTGPSRMSTPRHIYPMQSAPLQAMTLTPAVNVAIELPSIPIIGHSIGKVLDIGREDAATSWIEIRDDIFNETLKIKIKTKNVPVLKKATVMSFNDIKIGDILSVIFNQEGEEISANFISILTKEDLEAMKESIDSQSTLVPESDETDFPDSN